MIEYNYEELETAPLIVNAIYKSGDSPNISTEPLHQLLPRTSNQGGFRITLRQDNKKPAYVVIYTSFEEPEWPDHLDVENGVFRYYGDNRSPGNDLHSTRKKGNLLLKDVFSWLNSQDEIRDVPPFLIFKKTGVSRNVQFLGLAAPGKPEFYEGDDLIVISKSKNNETFSNYEAYFTIIDTTDEPIERVWLEKLIENHDNSLEYAPSAWKKFVENGKSGLEPLTPLKRLSKFLNKSFKRRYITSLLAKPFVILTGNSGTGKTRIARNFAKYMEVTDENGEKNWLIVPVGADWTDNIKVLGFYNPLADNGKGKYEKTKILELIERANQNPNIPFFLVLDEMNLSHVERYFSDFLSHMERKDSEFEFEGYEGKLSYPDNLFVVGTVNIDETTYMFSPKVLDRANVIEFKPDKDDVMKLFKAEPEKSEIEPAGYAVAAAFLKLSREIRNGKYDVQNISRIDVTSRLTEVFGELYDKASEQGFEFAFRTVKEIKQYISAAYELQEDKSKFDLNQAIDEQIVQKILPKIHGNKKEIGNMLDKLEKLCNESNMTLSLIKIKQMRGKLDTVQYASFI